MLDVSNFLRSSSEKKTCLVTPCSGGRVVLVLLSACTSRRVRHRSLRKAPETRHPFDAARGREDEDVRPATALGAVQSGERPVREHHSLTVPHTPRAPHLQSRHEAL